MHILQNRFFLYYMPHSPSYLFVSGTYLLYRTYCGTSRTGNIEKKKQQVQSTTVLLKM